MKFSLPLKAFLPSALWGEGLGKTDELGRHGKYDNIHWWSILVRRACLVHVLLWRSWEFYDLCYRGQQERHSFAFLDAAGLMFLTILWTPARMEDPVDSCQAGARILGRKEKRRGSRESREPVKSTWREAQCRATLREKSGNVWAQFLEACVLLIG